MFRFIHTADIHLDSPMKGLASYEGAPRQHWEGVTRRAFENLVQLALDECVDFMVIAGDLYDGDWRDYNTGLFFSKQMARLNSVAMPVFIVQGNHDAASEITRNLDLPPNVRVFASNQAETHTLPELRVALHGRSYHQKAELENLAKDYPPRHAGYYNIGVLHTALMGREGHETYAPCHPLDLESKGYQYWALGHVHQAEIVQEAPYIVFPGNLQARHIRELGPKGCWLVEVDDDQETSLQFRDVDVARFFLCVVDVETVATAEDLIDHTLSQIRTELRNHLRPLAVRVLYKGRSPLHTNLQHREEWLVNLRSRCFDWFSDQVWIQRLKVNTEPPVNPNTAVAQWEFSPQLRETSAQVWQETELLAELKAELHALKRRLPGDAFGESLVDWEKDEQALKALIDEASDWLIQELEGRS